MPEKLYYLECAEGHSDSTVDLFTTGQVPFIPESKIQEAVDRINAYAEDTRMPCRYYAVEAPPEVAAAIANS